MLNENVSFAESIDRLKESFLWAAAQGGNSQDCASLIEIGADVNWKNADGDTPLLAACRRGHTETIELLLSHGADSNITGNDSHAPLHICARRGDANSVDVLLNANTNTALKNGKGQTALDIAKEKGHEAVYSRIFRHRPGLNRLGSSNPVNPVTSSGTRGNASTRPELPILLPPARLARNVPPDIREIIPTVAATASSSTVNESQNNSRRSNNTSSSSSLNSNHRSSANNNNSHNLQESKERSEDTVDRLISSFDQSLSSRSERFPSSSTNNNNNSTATNSSSSNNNNNNSNKYPPSYAIIGQTTANPNSSANSGSIDETSSVIALKRLLDAEKVAKSILEAKLEVFASQNKQLLEEYRIISEEQQTSQEMVQRLQQKVQVYEGEYDAIKRLTSIDECEDYEKRLKKTLVILEERKTYLTKNLIESQKEQRLCVICQEKEKSVVLLPCRHLCLCDQCSAYDELDLCPLCRKPVAHKISVFN